MTNTQTVLTSFAVAASATTDFAKALAAEAKTGTLKEIMVGRSDTFRVNPYSLSVKEGWNSRDMADPENVAHVDALAQSIAAKGVLEPLTVFHENGKIVVTNGHCRLLATFRAIEVYGAEVKSVPVQTEPRGSNDGDRLRSQVIRNSGKRLTALETANVVKRLIVMGDSVPTIAKDLSISVGRVNQLLDLASAPAEVHQMVRSGEVAATTAMGVVKALGTEKAVETLKDGVVKAKNRGKTKVTGKDLNRLSTKATLKAVFDRATVDNSDEAKTVVTFTAADFEIVRKALGL